MSWKLTVLTVDKNLACLGAGRRRLWSLVWQAKICLLTKITFAFVEGLWWQIFWQNKHHFGLVRDKQFFWPTQVLSGLLVEPNNFCQPSANKPIVKLRSLWLLYIYLFFTCKAVYQHQTQGRNEFLKCFKLSLRHHIFKDNDLQIVSQF